MTKHLSSSNLSALDTFWQRWPAEAGTPKQRRIRLRLYMVYLLIRHGGLRLSEALNVNDNRDLVFSTSTIHVARDRDVQVEEQAMNRMLSIVEDSALTEYHGTITHIDHGYVRKNFYQAAEACGLEKELGAREFSATHGASNFWKEASPSPSFRNTLAWPALFRPYA